MVREKQGNIREYHFLSACMATPFNDVGTMKKALRET